MPDTQEESSFDLSSNATVSGVARRSFALAAIVCRGSIEGGTDHKEREALHKSLIAWLTLLDVWDFLEPIEKKLLDAPIGTLQRSEVIQSTWYVEGLAILAWALNKIPYPVHDRKVDPFDVTENVGLLDEDAGEILHTAHLRNAIELDACREFLYIAHCQIRHFIKYRREGSFRKTMDIRWLSMLGINESHLLIADDLSIDGKTLGDTDEERLRECENIICERHRAIIWLVEGHPLYTQTPVDT